MQLQVGESHIERDNTNIERYKSYNLSKTNSKWKLFKNQTDQKLT